MKDVGHTIGMTVGLPRLDLEAAFTTLGEGGFEYAEVFLGQLGPGVVEVPLFPGHAAALADLGTATGVGVSTLNCIVGGFHPFGGADALRRAAEQVCHYLKLGHAAGAPRILIWDGELEAAEDAREAPDALAECVRRAVDMCELDDPPAVAVELHPNTFAFMHRVHDRTAERLRSVGAGVCLDFAHAGVALGPDFMERLGAGFLEAVTHVHYADSDCATEQLHVPPGHGVLDLDAALARLSGTGLPVAWDLFGWQSPRAAVARGMDRYRAAVSVVSGGRAAAAP